MKLFDDTVDLIRRFIVVGENEAVALTLWVAHTWAFAASDITPYIWISSAEKQSGKSSLLRLLSLLVANPVKTTNISEAALFRMLGAEQERTPTLLFDEIDTIFGPKARDREDMRGLLNDGFERGATVHRCVGEGSKMKPAAFAVFGPKCFAGIGRKTLPDTLVDRSIEVGLKKKARDEHVERFRARAVAEATAPFRAAFEEWANAETDRLRENYPDLPEELDDRAQDMWEPLLQIADYVGGAWPEVARRAALALSVNGDRGNESYRVELLAAIRDVFDAREDEADHDRISTSDLIRSLAADDEMWWTEWWDTRTDEPARGSQRKLASILKEFGIHSETIRLSDGAKKGYKRAAFSDPFSRYVPAKSVTSVISPPSTNGRVTDVTTVTLLAKGAA